MELNIYHFPMRNKSVSVEYCWLVNIRSAPDGLALIEKHKLTVRIQMSKRKSSALRREQEMSNKHTQTFYQKHRSEDATNTIQFNPQKQRKPINLVPKSINQENYILALQDQTVDIVGVTGPAGTGKTYLAMLAAIQAYRNKEVSRIVLTRPAVEVDGEKHGFLPGDLNSKMEPWTRPLLDVLREYYAVKEIEHMLAEQIVEIAPLAFMRGRTFKDSFIIADEMQNATPAQVKMLMTRIGQGSKIVITGDIEQTDRRTKDNGLADLEDRIVKYDPPGMALCQFDARDIQRHSIIEHVLKMYSK
jgi:phosphate starvation-inducible PhoH-like protein